MRALWLAGLLVLSTATAPAAAPAAQQSPLPRRQPLPASGLLAAGATRPGEQVDVPGRRAIWIGTESGGFEAWVYPLKVIRDLRLRFRLGAQEIDAAQLARHVEVRPEWTTITYVHEAFTVRQLLATPIDQPLLLSLLAVDASIPLTIDVTFHIDLHPMWPAGLGGQYSSWDAQLPGFTLGDGSGTHAGVVMSPAAGEPTVQPAHSLPDQPTRFSIPIDPQVAAEHWYPIVVGAWTSGMQAPADAAALRQAASEMAVRPAPALQRIVDHYRALSADSVQIRTPEPGLDESLAWASVRLDQGLVCNPHLGCGLVAGYGPSGAGYRPGFAWFFGGDAFYNSWALTALGAHATVRQALQMLADNQRADGKIMHELSQGAGLLRWFEDYPYGFYHAETTPYFIDAVVGHAVATGDLEWARQMWPRVLRALEYCRSTDVDGDGLMDNSAAGLAAVEMGALRELRVHADIYLASVWTRALSALPRLAAALGERDVERDAEQAAARARRTLEQRLGVEGGGWAFAVASDGSRVQQPTVWNVLPAALGVGEPARAQRALRETASPDITTDWGTRMLSNRSALYDPLVYNQGTVWPFLSGFAAMAAYRHGNPAWGKDLLDGLVDLTVSHSRGAIHEVLSGDRLAPMDASVPHQLFSTSSLVTPLLGGMFGIDVDRLAGRLTVAPQLPSDWPQAEVIGLRWGEARIDLRLRQERGRIELQATQEAAASPPALFFAPWLPAGAELAGGHLGGAGACRFATPARDVAWSRAGDGWVANAAVTWSAGLPFDVRGPRAEAGGHSIGLRVIGCELDERRMIVDVAGTAGVTYVLNTDADVEVAGEAGIGVRVSAAGVWHVQFDGQQAGYRAARLSLSRRPR